MILACDERSLRCRPFASLEETFASFSCTKQSTFRGDRTVSSFAGRQERTSAATRHGNLAPTDFAETEGGLVLCYAARNNFLEGCVGRTPCGKKPPWRPRAMAIQGSRSGDDRFESSGGRRDTRMMKGPSGRVLAHNNEIQGTPQAYLLFVVTGRTALRWTSRGVGRAPLISMPLCSLRTPACIQSQSSLRISGTERRRLERSRTYEKPPSKPEQVLNHNGG